MTLFHIHFGDTHRVVTLGGRRVGDADWKEEEHPRKKTGQFAPKGDGEAGSGAEPSPAPLPTPSPSPKEKSRVKLPHGWEQALRGYDFKRGEPDEYGNELYTDGKYDLWITPPPGTGAPAIWTLHHHDVENRLFRGTTLSELDDVLKRVGKTYTPETPEQRAAALLTAATDVVKTLGFPRHMMTFSDDTYEFELNGRKRTAGGVAYTSGPNKGHILLYLKNLAHATPEQVAGVAAHEVMHQKYQAYLDDYHNEHRAWIAEAIEEDKADRPREERVMNNAGYMTEIGKNKYPLLAADGEIMGGHSSSTRSRLAEFKADDGITDYSRDWWKEVSDLNADVRSAFHETLAEMAKLENEGSLDRLLWYKNSNTWKPLYKLVKRHYKEHHWKGEGIPVQTEEAA